MKAALPPVAYAWSGGLLKDPEVAPRLDWKYVATVKVLEESTLAKEPEFIPSRRSASSPLPEPSFAEFQ
jgi:hypothetical protein